jgi:molybdate transport system regulatory protein
MMTSKLTRSQVAQMLGVTTKTLYTWEKEGRVEAPERDWRGWRWYSASQVEALRRLTGARSEQRTRETEEGARFLGEPAAAARPGLEISARNRLVGTVKAITSDGVLAEVVLDLGGGNEIVSVITRASVERLGLQVGVCAVALVKATEVMLARET